MGCAIATATTKPCPLQQQTDVEDGFVQAQVHVAEAATHLGSHFVYGMGQAMRSVQSEQGTVCFPTGALVWQGLLV